MNLPSTLLPDPTLLLVDAIELDESSTHITLLATVTQATACCPLCKQAGARVHSHYERTLADLPWADVPVQLRLTVRRFICDNRLCERTIFCERIAPVASAWARRTQRLAGAQAAIGLAAGGAGGARLCAALSIDAGIDLLLSLIRHLPLPERPTPRVLGVDDWAQKKGQRYGTILIDLEAGQVVELLPDRTAESLAQWLQEHPGVEIISRDRAGAYAEGATAGAPDALQVADRWHLLKNLTDALYKILQQHQAAIAQGLRPPDQALQPLPEADKDPFPPLPDDTPAAADLRVAEQEPPQATLAEQRRQARAAEAHRLHQLGWTAKDIAAQLDLHPKTVGRYLNASLPLIPQRRVHRERLLDAFKPYLLERWNAGCHSATQLWREIQAQGFPGQISIVRAYAAELRKASGLPPGVRSASARPLLADPSQRPPTLRALAHLVTRVPASLEDDERAYVIRLSELHPALEEAVRLSQAFAAMIRHKQADRFDDWLEQATQSTAAPLRNFALGLQRDEAAVRAALSLPWSNDWIAYYTLFAV
jgi:transposase